ncbi:lipopolysaccharide biosynthesis protein [Aliivibrio fischeri]|uniref:lipopolysaccharide biosynthesis protein n=1 Tax=Aliivibrio fischeri TaxID=668 RepID=UPI000907DB6D|nr:lipopolysaccharide biosynthesis protein [Aliivibrio fischeri]
MNSKKIFYFSIGPFGSALLGFITLPIITWFFSQDDIGRVSMMQLLLNFTTMFYCLGLDQAYIREFHETKKHKKLFKIVITPGLLLLFMTVLIIFYFEFSLSKYLFGDSSFKLDILILLGIISSYFSRFLSLILRMKEKALAFSLSQLMPKVFYLFLLWILLLIEVSANLSNLVIVNIVSICLTCIIFSWNTRYDWIDAINEKISIKELKPLLQFGLPLLMGGLAYWALTATDKILIRKLSTYNELGIYSVSVSFAAAAILFQRVFSTVWAPTIYKWSSNNIDVKKINEITRFVLLFVILLFCLSGLFSWLVDYLLPDNYSDVKWLVISCFGAPLLYTLSETTVIGIGITRKSSFGMLASIIAFIVNLLCTIILVPIYGGAGAAASTCFSFWVFFLLRTEFSNYLWIQIPRIELYIYTCLAVLGACVSTLFGKDYAIQIYLYWLILLSSTFLIFKKEYKFMYMKIKLKLSNSKSKGEQ